MKKWQSFVSLTWYDGLISFIFRFLAKTSEPVLAFGVIISASDFLQKGQLMAHNPTLVTAWAWTQAFAIEASTGPVLASSLSAFRAGDTIKGVLYACLAGLLFVVGGAMLLLQLISNITGHSEATINPFVLYTLLTLRVLVASGIVALLCTKHMRFSGDEEKPALVPVTVTLETAANVPARVEVPEQAQSLAASRFASKEQEIVRVLQTSPHLTAEELAQVVGCSPRTAQKWSAKYKEGLTA